MKKIKLPQVACVQIEAMHPDRAARVLNWCAQYCDFGDVILFSPQKPTCDFVGRWIQIPRFGYVGYSTFSTKCLGYYIEHDYALVTQHDGFILHPEKWSQAFLEWDYIGAPWPVSLGGPRVGNSGFSLRSKRFLRACAASNIPHNNEADTPNARRYAPGVDAAADDIWMCWNPEVRRQMESLGLRYAPLDVARHFACELEIEEGISDADCFGFHAFGPPHREAYKQLVGWVDYPRKEEGTLAQQECPACAAAKHSKKGKWSR